MNANEDSRHRIEAAFAGFAGLIDSPGPAAAVQARRDAGISWRHALRGAGPTIGPELGVLFETATP